MSGWLNPVWLVADAGPAGIELGTQPWTWTLDALQLLPVALAALLYTRRARTLARRRRPVASWRRLCFYAGLALLLVAFVSPIDALGEERLLFAHMVQHILIGDLGALLLVAGLSGPLLRPVLALPYLGRLRTLAHPLVALPLWVLNLYLWHLPGAYQAALAHDAVHAVQHACFFATGALIWAALLEPLPGPAWFGSGYKALYVVAVRLIETVLANIFIWSGHPFYPRYAHAPRLWGISATADQAIGGSIMMIEGSLLTLGILAWLFLRWMNEGERAQRLVEQGVPARRAERAVRYGHPDTAADTVEPAPAGADPRRESHDLTPPSNDRAVRRADQGG